MNKSIDNRIEELKNVLKAVVEANLQFAGYWDANGKYIPTSLQNPNIDPQFASRFLGLACALDPLRGKIEQI